MSIEYKIKASKDKRTLSDVTFVDKQGKRRELTYWLHDYGRLAYWMKKHGKITGDPLWDSLLDIYELDEFFEGQPNPARLKWYLWHLGKLTEIAVTERIDTSTFKLGTFGRLAFEAAKKSSGRVSWSEAMENIVIARLIAKKLENIGNLLTVVNLQPIPIHCVSHLKDNQGQAQISAGVISTSIKDVYLMLAEPPDIIQDLRSLSDPLILSTFLFNEVYYSMSNVREKIVNQVALSGNTVNPYILTDRGSYEIKRALEKIGILTKRRGQWYTTLPDKLLLSIVWYSFVKSGRKSITMQEFANILKEDFRFLVEPNQVRDFLLNKVSYQTLGIDFEILNNNLETNYSKLLERLVNLGFASIRPDGEAIIETAI